jgi:cell division protein FtsQ
VALALVIAGAGGFTIAKWSDLMDRATVLRIDRITVRGTARLPDEAVRELLDGLTGENLLLVDLEAWRHRVLASPWVRDAVLRRVLPSTVDVTVTERLPAAIGRIMGELMLIDASGVLIDRFGPRYADLDLPIVDGLDVAVLAPGGQASDRRTGLAFRLLTSLQRDASIAKQVSQVDVSDAHNARVTLSGDPAVLYVGETEFLTRIRTYLQLAKTLRVHVSEIRYVDLRFGERIYVGPADRAGKAIERTTGTGPASGRSARGGTRE